MNSSYLQFVFAMVLVINGIIFCKSDQEMLRCVYRGNDVTETFTVVPDAEDEEVSLDVNANITCTTDARDGKFSFIIVCPVEWRILLRVPEVNGGIVVEAFDGEGEPSFFSENRPPNFPSFLLSQTNFLEISADYSDGLDDRMWKRTFRLSVWTVKVSEQIGPDSSCQVKQTSKDSPKTTATCEGRCDAYYNESKSCQCNKPCIRHADCCNDYRAFCGNDARTLEIECSTNSLYDNVLVSLEIGRMGRYFTFICTRFDGQSFDVNFSQSIHLGISCKRMLDTLSIDITAPPRVNILEPGIHVETIFFNRDSSLESETGKSTTTQFVVPTVVVLAALGLGVFIASIWYKRRNKHTSANAENVSPHTAPYLHNHVSSEEGDATDKNPRYVTSNAEPEGDGTVALNIRSTVNQNEDTVVYNEIGEQDYNTLFGGKERNDYHEYNVPDRPQGKSSVDRTTASGSGPYQELLKDGTRAVPTVNMSPGVKRPRHGKADDLHAYQDLRQDDGSVSGIHPNGEMPNQLSLKDTPPTENGYQALKTATPATLEQNDQSTKGTSDVSEPPSDKQYDTLQRRLNTVGQPPSAGYGTLKPINETDADYEYQDGKPKTTSDFQDPTRPTEALPISQPKARHSVSYDDDDYQTPIKPAEDLTNAYQTLDNPGYQQEPDEQAEDYSHLQRSPGAKLQSHPSSNHDNNVTYGKLYLNGTS